MWQCLIKSSGTCNPHPEWEIQAKAMESGGEIIFVGGKCRLKPESCGKYQEPPVIELKRDSLVVKKLDKKGKVIKEKPIQGKLF